jgi:hypothetical protein
MTTYTIDRPKTSASVTAFSAGLPASVNTFEVDYRMPAGSYSYPVTIKNNGAVDLSTFDATVIGQDIYGNDLRETGDLTTAGNTMTTTALFSSISRIETDVTGIDDVSGYQPTDDLNANVTALELISTGTMDIAVDGAAAVKIIGMDFNGVSDVPDIKDVLVTALAGLDVTVTESSDIITIESDSSGATSSVEVTAGTGAGTNVIKANYIVMGTSVDGEDATQGNMPTVDISGNTAGIEAIEDGKLDITIDGVLTQIEALNFDTVASTADIAAILVTALTALAVTVTEASDVITFESDSSGVASTIVVAAGTGTGTNVVAGGLIVMDTAVDGEDATQGIDITIDISGNVVAIELISLGALAIALDGGTKQEITGIDLNGIADIPALAVVLAASLSALPVTVTEGSDVVTVTSNTAGSSSAVAITAGAGAGGTNIVDTGLVTMDTAVPGVDDEILQVGYAVSSNEQVGIRTNWHGNKLGLVVNPGTSAVYTVEQSYSSLEPFETPLWFAVDDSDLVGASTKLSGVLTVPPVMIRVNLGTAGSTDTKLVISTTDV